MTFTTRVPVPSDATAIADLHVSTWREAYAHLLPEDFFSQEYIEGRQLRNGFHFDGVEQIDPHAPTITDARMVR